MEENLGYQVVDDLLGAPYQRPPARGAWGFAENGTRDSLKRWKADNELFGAGSGNIVLF